MSAQRARRQNAGNKLATMVAEERAKIASGEAALSDDDDDFARRAGDDDDDIVESDFEETDSEAERAADATSRDAEAMVERVERRRQRKTARKRRVVPHFAGTAPRQPAESPVGAVQARAQKRPMLAVRVSSRTLAMRKALETEERTQERELKAKRRRRRDGAADTQPALTQELLLEEAKATEIENLEKLREFQAQAAEDKQRLIATRRAPLMVRPVAHWRSCAVVGEAVAATGAEPAQGPAARRAATDYVLEGLDELRFPLNPWARRRPALRPRTCPVTGLPARYVHPRTRIPYANARAYRILEDLAQGQHAYLYDIGVWSSAAFATPPHV